MISGKKLKGILPDFKMDFFINSFLDGIFDENKNPKIIHFSFDDYLIGVLFIYSHQRI